MAIKRKRFSEEVRCEHWGHDTALEVIGPFSSPSSNPDFKTHYDLRFRPACHRMSLCQLWPQDDGTLSHEAYDFLYPTRRVAPAGLPPVIARAYGAAAKVKAIDVNAYGVLVGRLFEMVCTGRGATGSTLDEQLRDLATRQEIPDKLVNVAPWLRQMRDIGAHAVLVI